MLDVLVVGAGPAGTIAATVLARAGVRVMVVDRATFPREKLCGDTINPGTLALLRRLALAESIERVGLPIDGMIVSGEGGVRIEGRYPNGLSGRALTRSALDWTLLQEAMKAGANFEEGVTVRQALVSNAAGGPIVDGVLTGSNGSARSIAARVTIAADGRRSTLGFGLKLAHHPPRPRRWAIGAHFTNIPSSSMGEMHVRRGRYIGVAPLPGGLTNVCLVVPAAVGGSTSVDFADPLALLRDALAQDPALASRFAEARLVRAPIVLGPLAVDTIGQPVDGLLFAGDAAGFVDPMTGDGMRFAVRGGELAAQAALDALQHGWRGVHAKLAQARHREFASKWRFNRGLRALVASPTAVSAAARAARVAPGIVRKIIATAGDC